MKMIKSRKLRALTFIGIFLNVGWVMYLSSQQKPSPDATAKKPVELNQKQPVLASKEGTWQLIDSGALGINKISVGDSNDIWAACSDGKIYKLTAKGLVSKADGVDVAVAEDGTTFIIDKNGVLRKLNAKGGWDIVRFYTKHAAKKNANSSVPSKAQSSPSLPIQAKSVAVGNKNEAWVIDNKGHVYHFDEDHWEKVKNVSGEYDTGITKFAINAEELIFAIDKKGNIFRSDLEKRESAQKAAALKKASKTKKTAKKSIAPKSKTTSSKSKASPVKKVVKSKTKKKKKSASKSKTSPVKKVAPSAAV